MGQLKAVDLIIEISKKIADASDVQGLSALLREVACKHFKVDWCGLYVASKPVNENLVEMTANLRLPICWNEFCVASSEYDPLTILAGRMEPGQVFIHKDIKKMKKELENHCVEFASVFTSEDRFLSMPVLNSPVATCFLGLHREESTGSFNLQDKWLYETIRPVLAMVARTLMLHHHYELKRTAYEAICKVSNVHALVLDERLSPVMLPERTFKFLREVYNEKFELLPSSIMQWLNKTVAPKGFIEVTGGDWVMKESFLHADFICRACIVYSTNLEPLLLVCFDKYGLSENFSVLCKIGITKREMEVISFLPLGYSNKQIALAMGISESGVKKHLKKIGLKFGAQGRVEILFQAIQKKKELEKNWKLKPFSEVSHIRK